MHIALIQGYKFLPTGHPNWFTMPAHVHSGTEREFRSRWELTPLNLPARGSTASHLFNRHSRHIWNQSMSRILEDCGDEPTFHV